MAHLENKLSGLGYRFMITEDGEQVYSNMSQEDMRTGRQVAGEAMESAKALTASRYEVSVIKNTFWHGDRAFCITAVHPHKTDNRMINYLKNCILRNVYGILVFFIALTVGAYLKESVQQRLEDEKRRRDLITGISHDLRTPLTTVSGYLDGIADTPEKRMRYLKAIRTRTGNMISLVESLSEYSRLDKGFRYHMEGTWLHEYVEDYLEQNHTDLWNQKVETDFIYGKDRFFVRIDRKEFKRVFDNLFSNTVKYRQRGHSRVLLSMQQKVEGNLAELVYQDDGPGVPEECLGQIFDSFYRADISRNKAEKGSGIGLAVVLEIIRGHGGTVHAQNRGGLAVIIRLPIHQEEADWTV